MRRNMFFKDKKSVFLLFLFFGALQHIFSFDYGVMFSEGLPLANLSHDDLLMMGGAFSALVGIGTNPFIALTVLSGAGTFLNSGIIDPGNIPIAGMLMQLPIARMEVFVSLLVVTLVKFLLSMLSVSKVVSDATLGKIENVLGIVCTAGGAYFATSITNEYAAGIVAMGSGTYAIGAGVGILAGVIPFLSAALAYLVYLVIKTMMAALDILALLFSPIPGATGVFTVLKHILVSLYTWITLTNPVVSAIIGIVIVIIACLVFRKARRLELYYRKIYLIPFLNAIFRSGRKIPLVPKKLPRGAAAEFTGISICIEGFFMNRTTKLYKRERCYFVRAGEENYIFKKRLLGKKIKVELSGDIFIEKLFRFIRIFSDEGLETNHRKIHFVLSREHGSNFEEIIAKAGFFDYNFIIEERRRKIAEARAAKLQKMKDQASQKLTAAGNKIRGVFGNLFSRK